jgi:hypothetical protein
VSTNSKILDAVKQKFDQTVSSADKMSLLTIAAAAEYSAEKIASFFNTSRYLATKAIELYKEQGLLSVPKRRISNILPEENTKIVQDFFVSDEVSKMLPGKKDFVNDRDENGKKVQVQKRMLLYTLKNSFEMFKENHPDTKVGWSKFTQLRPRQVVFPGSPGTLAMCICLIHVNPEMMFEVLVKVEGAPRFKDCSELIHLMMCNPASPVCCLGQCDVCPGPDKLIEKLYEILKNEAQLTYSQWVLNERCSLQVVTNSSTDFVDVFVEGLQKLRPHRFLVKMQHEYFVLLKNNLERGHVLILADYAENYSCVIQNAIQSNHWQHTQATIHVFVCLYKDENGVLQELNYVSISDYHKHETKAVHLFQTKLMPRLKAKVPFDIEKVTYITDGCAAQYKNRFNFCNLMHHERDFGMPATWHFHPTSHGKNLCDGVGGTIKRNAYRTSLQRGPTDQIDTAKKFYDYVKTLPKIECDFTTAADHVQHNRAQSRRFRNCPPVTGCRAMHAFIPVDNNTLLMKPYSLSPNESTVRM